MRRTAATAPIRVCGNTPPSNCSFVQPGGLVKVGRAGATRLAIRAQLVVRNFVGIQSSFADQLPELLVSSMDKFRPKLHRNRSAATRPDPSAEPLPLRAARLSTRAGPGHARRPARRCELVTFPKAKPS